MGSSKTEQYLDTISFIEEFTNTVKFETKNDSLIKNAEQSLMLLNKIKSTLKEELIEVNKDKERVNSQLAEIYKQPEKPNSFSCTPSFIIGNRRSGTTLLTAIINASENIAAVPESFFAGKIANNDHLFKAGHDLTTRLGLSDYNFFNGLGKFIDSMHQEFSLENNKSRWISKELFHPHRLDRLDRLFDYHSKFVYIVRHGFNVASSCTLRFAARDGAPYHEDTSLNIETYLREWVRTNELTMNFYERNKDRCLLIRYEDLTKKPELTTQKVYNFLDEPWHPNVLKLWGEQLDSRRWVGDHLIHSTRGQIIEDQAKWLDWPEHVVKYLAKIANPTLVRLGYEAI